MTDKGAENIIVKFLTSQAGEEDIEMLTTWLQEPENERLFDAVVKTNLLIDHNLQSFNAEKAKMELLHKIRKDKKRVPGKRYGSFLKYAAVLVMFLGIGYFFQDQLFLEQGQEQIIPANESISLELEDGTIEMINPEVSKEVRDSKGNLVGKQEKEVLTYAGDSEEVEELVYNTLRVPYGKKFQLELSDGSLVHLNSGSSIKYPVRFLSEGERSVYLIGEAYFDITSSPDKPFVVNAEKLNVEVLGTTFNVSSYPEDHSLNVVLVEGKVALYAMHRPEEAVILSPGSKGTFSKAEDTIEVTSVNPKIYTAWRDGELVFRNMAFDNILKKLERQFHVKIINNNPELSNQVFNASFDNEELTNILEYFNESYAIDYTIKNNTVIFN